MSVPDFDPLGPIQARIAVACSGARWDGALLGLSDEGRRRPSSWALGGSLMPPMRRLRRRAPARGWRVTGSRQRRVQGPRITISALAIAIPNSLQGSRSLHDTTDLGPSALFDHAARKIARWENLRGLGRRVVKSDTGALARLQPGEGTAFVTRQPRVRFRSEARARLGRTENLPKQREPVRISLKRSRIETRHTCRPLAFGAPAQDVQGPEGSRSPAPLSQRCLCAADENRSGWIVIRTAGGCSSAVAR